MARMLSEMHLGRESVLLCRTILPQKLEEAVLKELTKVLSVAALSAMMLMGSTAMAQRGAARPAPEGGEAAEAGVPIPPETKSETKHDWTVGSRPVHYTATAGTLLIKDAEGKPNQSVFYVAYTEDGAPAKSRPVTFLYNGGPGSASLWLHMGSVGPVRVVTDSPKASGPAPFSWVPNQYRPIWSLWMRR
jgi:carboxypeptidase C (cathepsin A)